MSKNKQTAVEWLIEQMIVNNYVSKGAFSNSDWLIRDAKEMEKEQMYDAFSAGYESSLKDTFSRGGIDFDQYFKEIFKQQEE